MAGTFFPVAGIPKKKLVSPLTFQFLSYLVYLQILLAQPSKYIWSTSHHPYLPSLWSTALSSYHDYWISFITYLILALAVLQAVFFQGNQSDPVKNKSDYMTSVSLPVISCLRVKAIVFAVASKSPHNILLFLFILLWPYFPSGYS